MPKCLLRNVIFAKSMGLSCILFLPSCKIHHGSNKAYSSTYTLQYWNHHSHKILYQMNQATKPNIYYPQDNGQVEATNEIILKILSKMLYKYKVDWSVQLTNAFWANRTSPRELIGFSPYSLIYGSSNTN